MLHAVLLPKRYVVVSFAWYERIVEYLLPQERVTGPLLISLDTTMLRKLSRQPLCGFLPVIKPAGVSSRDVVNMAVTALKEKKIGHTGTLDPFATGVLVLAVGPMTRFIPVRQNILGHRNANASH